MNGKMVKLLKRLGLSRSFIIILMLRCPFDFVNAFITANMLERFILLTESGDESGLTKAFFFFLTASALLFIYNMSVWCTISMRFCISFQKGLRKTILDIILGYDQSRLDKLSAGEMMTVLNSDVDKALNYLAGPLNTVHMACALVNMLLSSAILLRLSLPLFIIAVAVMLPFMFLSTKVVTRKVPVFKKEAQKSFARFTDIVPTAVEAQPVLKIYRGEKLLESRAKEISLDIMKNNMKAHNRIAWTYFINTFSGILGYVLLLLAGNSMIGTRLDGFARLTKITQYRGTMMQSAMTVTACVNNRKANLAGVERVCKILEEDVKNDE